MGNRTPDLLNAIEALYQLSYDPVNEGGAVLPPRWNNQVPKVEDFFKISGSQRVDVGRRSLG